MVCSEKIRNPVLSELKKGTGIAQRIPDRVITPIGLSQNDCLRQPLVMSYKRNGKLLFTDRIAYNSFRVQSLSTNINA